MEKNHSLLRYTLRCVTVDILRSTVSAIVVYFCQSTADIANAAHRQETRAHQERAMCAHNGE